MKLSYIIREGIIGIKRSRMPFMISVFSVTIALLIVGLGVLAVDNSLQFIGEFQADYDLEIFLENEATTFEKTELAAIVKDYPGIFRMDYLSKEDAAALYNAEFGEDVLSLLDDNPLPSSFRITFEDDHRSADYILTFIQNMNELDIQIARAHKKAVIITGSSMGLMFLILLLIIMKASNLIRLKTDQLVEARDNLEENVVERTQEIKQTYERLQEAQKRLSRSEKLAGIGTLAAGVAHEINNPLASVASCAEGLMNRMDSVDFKSKDDEEVFPDYLKTIYDEAYRCKAIISKLLDFSGRQAPVFGQVDMNALVANVVKLIGRQIELKELSIELNYSPVSITIHGDDNQLQQVFLNMILNAIDATVDGGKIKITTIGVDNYAQIIFEDTGCGIAPDNLDKVFEPFFTTKSPGKGTGLGLSICYGIIEEHKGKFSVSSNGRGKGSAFTISLPIYEKT